VLIMDFAKPFDSQLQPPRPQDTPVWHPG
jgi:hypothetical protein